VAELNNNPEAARKYNNFLNYMELRAIAGEDNDEVYATNPAFNSEPHDQVRNNPYHPNNLSNDMIGGLDKKSKGIKKTGKKNNTIKDKEKARRMKGQSSIATWKPDLFMKLRQEYD
jgi:hypothetical protein